MGQYAEDRSSACMGMLSSFSPTKKRLLRSPRGRLIPGCFVVFMLIVDIPPRSTTLDNIFPSSVTSRQRFSLRIRCHTCFVAHRD